MRAQEQWRTEQQLREHLAEAGLHVERGVALAGFAEKADHVACELTTADGASTTVRAKFLAGCDGGGSTVRKGLGLAFPGMTTHESFFAIHAHLENYVGACPGHDHGDIIGAGHASGELLSAGFAFTMPMPGGGFLIICDLDEEQQEQWLSPPDDVDHHGRRKLLQPTAEDVCAALRARGCGADLRVVPGSVRWCTHFHVNSRQAPEYGRGRVVIAGDACHCHSPLGGQGMNMGFQDAKNLGWKIAACANGWLAYGAGARLLATYEAERRGLEKLLLAAIERAQEMSSARNPLVTFLRGRGQRMIGLLTSVQAAAAKFVAQQGWSYKDGPLAHEHWERPGVLRALAALGGYRRRQNLYRWLGTRVRGGDRVPNAALASPSTRANDLHAALKRSKGWSLLLFEGDPGENEAMRAALGAPVFDAPALRRLGARLRALLPADEGGIDAVIVFEHGSAQGRGVHAKFDVRGQCLLLVRPDYYVGLRCEPVREAAVPRYFARRVGLRVDPARLAEAALPRCPPSARAFDPVPVVAWAAVAAAGCAAVVHHQMDGAGGAEPGVLLRLVPAFLAVVGSVAWLSMRK